MTSSGIKVSDQFESSLAYSSQISAPIYRLAHQPPGLFIIFLPPPLSHPPQDVIFNQNLSILSDMNLKAFKPPSRQNPFISPYYSNTSAINSKPSDYEH